MGPAPPCHPASSPPFPPLLVVNEPLSEGPCCRLTNHPGPYPLVRMLAWRLLSSRQSVSSSRGALLEQQWTRARGGVMRQLSVLTNANTKIRLTSRISQVWPSSRCLRHPPRGPLHLPSKCCQAVGSRGLETCCCPSLSCPSFRLSLPRPAPVPFTASSVPSLTGLCVQGAPLRLASL